MTVHKRDLVFISHATPEDNIFTLWLSARLKVMGYQVWSDVTQLFGGEKWWNDIEQAVDDYTIKFVLVITRTSLSKPGVRREVELALAAEEKYQLHNFIIPVIIDDSEFGGQPYGLSERNIIPFAKGWAPALGRLVDRFDKDCVPKGEVPADLGQKLGELASPRLVIGRKNDLLISNWLKLTDAPTHLNFYRLPGEQKSWRTQFSECPYSWFEWGGMLVSFAKKEDFSPYLPKFIGMTDAPRLSLQSVLENAKHNYQTFQRAEVIKKLNFLIAEAWGLKMLSLGLHKYELASGKVAWFFPDHENFSGRISFPDVFGALKNKQILGFSPKNNVFWHYAIEVKIQYGLHARASLIPHVVFSEDGQTPLNDKAKMHRLRRGFCKSWWNDRWRDMLLLYMHMVAQGTDALHLPVGENLSLTFNSRPEFLETEFALLDSGAKELLVDSEGADAEIDFDVEVDLQ